MTEIIGNAATWQVFASAAEATGLTDVQGVPLAGGPLAAGGSWFYNAVLGGVWLPTGETTKDAFGRDVPVMKHVPGEWARVRINGDFPQLPAMIVVWRAHGITVYEQITPPDMSAPYWSADGGVTRALDWVATIGQIM